MARARGECVRVEIELCFPPLRPSRGPGPEPESLGWGLSCQAWAGDEGVEGEGGEGRSRLPEEMGWLIVWDTILTLAGE